jgi:hypothetical protein
VAPVVVIPEKDSKNPSTKERSIINKNGIDPNNPRISQKITVTRKPSCMDRELMSFFEIAYKRAPVRRVIAKRPKKL